MSEERPRYVPGDIVNGHILGADGRWVPIAAPAASPGTGWAPQPHPEAGWPPQPYPGPGWAPTDVPGTTPGHDQLPVPAYPPPGQAAPAHYRPGDVVNGYVLNARYEWEPAPMPAEVAQRRRPPAPVALGAGIVGFLPFLGGLFSVLAIALGARVVAGRADGSSRDVVLGIIAVVLGVVGLVANIWLY